MINTQISNVINHLQNCDIDLVPQTVNVRIPDARQNLYTVLRYLEPNLQWLPEYETVASWLADNHGRGLLCMGNLGRGKTLICARAIPILLNHFNHLIVKYFDAQEMNSHINELCRYHLICIDDIGTEAEYVRYGEHRIPLSELVDHAEKHGTLLLLTTNLTIDELTAKYGARTVDRLRSITTVALFQGQSMRC